MSVNHLQDLVGLSGDLSKKKKSKKLTVRLKAKNHDKPKLKLILPEIDERSEKSEEKGNTKAMISNHESTPQSSILRENVSLERVDSGVVLQDPSINSGTNDDIERMNTNELEDW